MNNVLKPYITIITSTFNSEKTIQRCIDSVANQTFVEVEHLFVDGASTDGTADIIAKNAQRKNTRISWWKSEPDTGIYNAWNKAVPHIRGEWVLFLGADDYLAADDVLEKMAVHLRRSFPAYRIVYGKLEIISEKTEKTVEILGKPWQAHKGKFEMGRISLPGHPEVFQHATLFNGTDSFDEQFTIAGDSDFLIRELKDHDAQFVPVVVTKHTMAGVSADYKNLQKSYDECRIIMNKYALHIPIHAWFIEWAKVKIKILLYSYLSEKNANLLRDIGRMVLGKKALWSKSNN